MKNRLRWLRRSVGKQKENKRRNKTWGGDKREEKEDNQCPKYILYLFSNLLVQSVCTGSYTKHVL